MPVLDVTIHWTKIRDNKDLFKENSGDGKKLWQALIKVLSRSQVSDKINKAETLSEIAHQSVFL